MDKQAAISFLETYQPLPPDADMPGELIETYNEVRRYFIAEPDTRCIDLFLHSFGDGSGFGIYQIVDEVLRQFPSREVVPRLEVCLRGSRRSQRYWCAEMAACFPDPALIEPLHLLLQEDDFDIRSAAITAIFSIADERVDRILREAASQETETELREQINDAIEYRRGRA